MRRKLNSICMACASLILCLGGIYVYAFPETSVENRFSTGVVDIELDEYQITGNGEEKLWKDEPVVLPGMKISKIPRIENEGNDCYVRATVAFENIRGVSDENIYGMPDDWIKAEDGYYYYTKVLTSGNTVDLFRGISIPEDLPQEDEGKSFLLHIDVDAIQSSNFNPDFEKNSPWGPVEILKCTKKGTYNLSACRQADTQSLYVEYQGDAKKLIADPDDFFRNFPVLLPGDTYSDQAKIINNSSDDITLYFRSVPLDGFTLADEIELTIDCVTDGQMKRFYEGSLWAGDLSDDLILGTIPAGSEGVFAFSISVPKEQNNEASLMEGKVRWIFSTEKIVQERFMNPVKTGDMYRTGCWLLASGLSLAVISAVLFQRKREDKNKHERSRP